MKLSAIVVLVAFPGTVYAQDADMTALYDLCMAHQRNNISPAHPSPSSGYAQGFEFCDNAVAAWKAAKEVTDAANEASNPDLKTARGLAKKKGYLPK